MPRLAQETTEEFNQRIDNLSIMAKHLVNVALGIRRLPKGEKANIPLTRSGKQIKDAIDKKDVLLILDDYLHQLNDTKKVFKAASHGNQKKTKQTIVGRGIASLLYVDDTLVEFVKRGNFGNVHDLPLSEQLLCLTEASITTRASLAKLFALYAYENKLVALAAENKNKQPSDHLRNILGVDKLLEEFFGDELDEMGNRGAKIHHGFPGHAGHRETLVSRQNFGYIQFATLIKNHTYDPIQDKLTDEQKDTIKVEWIKRPGHKRLEPNDEKGVEIELTGRIMVVRKHVEYEYNLINEACNAKKLKEGPAKRRKPGQPRLSESVPLAPLMADTEVAKRLPKPPPTPKRTPKRPL